MTTALKPYQRLDLATAYPELPDYLTPGEAHAIIEATTNRRDYLLFRVLWGTGQRISEALSLTLENIRDTDIRVKGKGGKVRMIPVKDDLISELLRYAVDLKLDYNQPVFHSNPAVFLSRSWAHRLLKKYAGIAGIKRNVNLHLFRHGYAVNFLKQVPNLVYLQQLLGHSSILTTRIYIRSAMPDIREALKEVTI